jgi:hypothetical protein
MRQLMFGQVMRGDLMWQAVGLNPDCLAANAGFFLLTFHSARRNDLLRRVGEQASEFLQKFLNQAHVFVDRRAICRGACLLHRL